MSVILLKQKNSLIISDLETSDTGTFAVKTRPPPSACHARFFSTDRCLLPLHFCYDANGNLTGDGASSYAYDVENRLIGRSGVASATLIYDALGRLSAINGAPPSGGQWSGCPVLPDVPRCFSLEND